MRIRLKVCYPVVRNLVRGGWVHLLSLNVKFSIELVILNDHPKWMITLDYVRTKFGRFHLYGKNCSLGSLENECRKMKYSDPF